MFFSRVAPATLVSAALLIMLAFCGCSDSDDPVDIVIPQGPVQSESPTVLMENFVTSYTGMDISDFEDILHDDFTLVLFEDTVTEWELEENAILNRDQMLLVHENMFGGIAGLNSEGYDVNPLHSIDVNRFEIQEIWAIPAIEDPDFPGTQRALYGVNILFLDNTGTHAFSVYHELYIYAEEVDDYWYLSGIKPRPFLGETEKGVEEASYDSVLYLYHAVPEKSNN